jgi:hypothetical protein
VTRPVHRDRLLEGADHRSINRPLPGAGEWWWISGARGRRADTDEDGTRAGTREASH